jgi:hypothetical protein
MITLMISKLLESVLFTSCIYKREE